MGQRWTPTSGIRLGCVLAVFALSLLLWLLYSCAGRIHDSLQRRVYIDDLTVWVRGDAGEPAEAAEAAAAALVVSRTFEHDMDWLFHEVKSKQFAKSAAARQ